MEFFGIFVSIQRKLLKIKTTRRAGGFDWQSVNGYY